MKKFIGSFSKYKFKKEFVENLDDSNDFSNNPDMEICDIININHVSENENEKDISLDEEEGNSNASHSELDEEQDKISVDDEMNDGTQEQVYNFETIPDDEAQAEQDDFISKLWQKDKFQDQPLPFDNEEDLLDSFFPDEFFEYITDMTNRYALQSLQKTAEAEMENRKRSHKAQWKATTAEEIKRYIAISLYMGLCRIPEKNHYWSRSSLLSNQVISKTFTRGRFQLLTRYTHFNDNALKTSSDDDPLFPVRPVLNFLEEIWAKNALASEYVTIDETIIPYFGRLKIKQYVPRKPNRYGIKAYVLATSKEGYILKWNLYTGKDIFNKTTNDIIMNLMAGLENKGIKLFTDNYFTSVKLMEKLEKIGIGLTGTVRHNRKTVRNQIQFNKKEFNVIIAKKCTNPGSNFIITGWKDKREVLMLSNVFNHKIVKDKRIRRTGKTEVFLKPLVIDRYNYYSHGVDMANQKASYYRLKKRTVKWYKYVFFYALEVHMVNCYVIYKKIKDSQKKRPIDPLDFRLKLIEKFIGVKRGENDDVMLFSSQMMGNQPRLKERHFMQSMPNNGRKDCVVCSDRKNKHRKTTTYMCKNCEVAVCPTNCFEVYHTELVYK